MCVSAMHTFSIYILPNPKLLISPRTIIIATRFIHMSRYQREAFKHTSIYSKYKHVYLQK